MHNGLSTSTDRLLTIMPATIGPDPSTYVTLVAPKVTATIREMDKDNETDSYVPPPIEIPFTVHQLYMNLFATNPLITEFPSLSKH